jgi:hypothetical protein
MYTEFQSENLNGKNDLGYPDIGGRIILKWMLDKHGVTVWTAFSWFKIWYGDVFFNSVVNLRVP